MLKVGFLEYRGDLTFRCLDDIRRMLVGKQVEEYCLENFPLVRALAWLELTLSFLGLIHRLIDTE